MHYRNLREAKNGEKVVFIDALGCAVIGVLYDATAGNDHCNGRLAPISPTDPCPDLKTCLHLDDVKEALKTVKNVATALLVGLCLLLAAAVCRADPASDAHAALALASAGSTGPSTCACDDPAECSCDGNCGCPNCFAWVRFADGDRTEVMLRSKRTGKQVGEWRFPTQVCDAASCHMVPGEYHRIGKNGHLEGTPSAPPLPPPDRVEDVAEPTRSAASVISYMVPGPTYQSGFGFIGGGMMMGGGGGCSGGG